MTRLAGILAERRRLAERYRSLLEGEERVILPQEPQGYRHVFQSYCVRLNTKKTQVQVMSEIAARDIATRRIIAIHLEPIYRKVYPELSLPETERATKETLLLPLFVGMTDDEQDQVVLALRQALD
jgi:dTDP-4-amino-4,6-dideoxygalactose transaminase